MLLKSIPLLAVLAVTLAGVAPAAADVTSAGDADADADTIAPNFQPQEKKPTELETAWYGYQIAGADVAVGASVVLIGPAALYGLLLTGPAVHVLNGQGGRALASFALRGGGVLGGVLIGGLLSEDCHGSDGCLVKTGVVVGAAVGLGFAALVDWLALGQKKTDRPRRVVVPFTTVERGGAVAGLAGTF